MPSLSFSPLHLSTGTSTNDSHLSFHFFGGSISQSWTNVNWRYLTFKIMQGTEPSNFSGFTSVTSYDSDLLLKVAPGLQNAPTTTEVTPGELWTINYTQATTTTATASGTATWFWAYADGTTNGTGTIPRLMLRGTCGAVGSGADMELDYPNIVSGSTYLISNLFKMNVPLIYSWT